MKYLKEITKWDKAAYQVPNHTYIVDGEWCYGYIKTGTKEEIMFSKRKPFSKSYRRFVDLKR